MKGALILAGVVIGGVYAVMKPGAETPTAESVVAMPRAALWAELAPSFASIEGKARHVTTVTGTPPYPVKFGFDRREGEMLALTGTAGFRTVSVKAWLEDGPAPGQTRLKVLFDPESLGAKTGDTDLRYQLRTILEKTDAQFVQGRRITALFGGRATPAD